MGGENYFAHKLLYTINSIKLLKEVKGICKSRISRIHFRKRVNLILRLGIYQVQPGICDSLPQQWFLSPWTVLTCIGESLYNTCIPPLNMFLSITCISILLIFQQDVPQTTFEEVDSAPILAVAIRGIFCFQMTPLHVGKNVQLHFGQANYVRMLFLQKSIKNKLSLCASFQQKSEICCHFYYFVGTNLMFSTKFLRSMLLYF